MDIWLSRADGSGAALLYDGSEFAGSPRWSPDGRRIAFDSTATGNFDIYAINAAGGEPPRLTEDSDFVDVLPEWSADGEWIYFTSNRSGRWEIWKASAAGGEPQQVTRQGGILAIASPDGEYLYYLKDADLPFFQHSPLWRMPVAGGEEDLVLERVFSRNFAVTEDGVYFMERPEASEAGARSAPTERTGFTVRYLNLANGEVRTLVALPPEVEPFWGFAVSPGPNGSLVCGAFACR